MSNSKLLKFGTTVPLGGTRRGWIALARPSQQQNGDVLVGDRCSSFAEVEAVVAKIRAELDDLLNEARVGFAP
jgi:hypothetical protein